MGRSQDDFIILVNKVHNHKYIYSQIKYINNTTKIEIICPIHSNFWQIPKDHLNGRGCRNCNDSTGEKEIRNYLQQKYIQEKTFQNCIFKGRLRFDFYIPKLHCLIEFDGI